MVNNTCKQKNNRVMLNGTTMKMASRLIDLISKKKKKLPVQHTFSSN